MPLYMHVQGGGFCGSGCSALMLAEFWIASCSNDKFKHWVVSGFIRNSLTALMSFQEVFVVCEPEASLQVCYLSYSIRWRDSA